MQILRQPLRNLHHCLVKHRRPDELGLRERCPEKIVLPPRGISWLPLGHAGPSILGFRGVPASYSSERRTHPVGV